MTGRDDAVADADLGIGDQVQQFRLTGVVPAQDGTPPLVLQQDRNTGVQVGDQQDPAGAVAGLHRASDQPVRPHRGQAVADRVFAAHVDGHAADEGTRIVTDDPCGDEGMGGCGHIVQQRGKLPVLFQESVGNGPVLQQSFVLHAKGGVLRPEIAQATHLVHQIGDGSGRAGHAIENGGDRIGEPGADVVHDDGIEFAQQHQGNGAGQQDPEGEATGQSP